MPGKFRKIRFDLLLQDALDRALPSAERGEEILCKMISVREAGTACKNKHTPETEQKFEDEVQGLIELINQVKPIDMNKYVSDGDDPEASSG